MRCALGALALLCAAHSHALADTVVIGARKDTTIYSESGTLSNGAGSQMFTGVTDNGATRRALIAFDIAGSIPPGSTITGVSLRLRLTRTRTGNLVIALHPATAAWGEAGSVAAGEQGAGAPAQTGDATWTHRLYASTTWGGAGGDYANNASATAVVGSTLTDYTWSSPGLLADVQAWYANPSANQGWILIAQASGTRETKRFATRSHGTTSARPRLTVTFTPPNPTGACCVADGSCSIVDAPGSACGGTYRGDSTSCQPNLCPQPTGACCARNATAACTVVTESTCVGNGGAFQGIDVTCAMTSCPVVLAPFVDPLPIPSIAQPKTGASGAAASYELAIVQLQRKVHSSLPPTTLWGFDDGTGASSPGPTIEAATGQPIEMTWTNDLREGGTLRTTHYLAVDSCVSTSAAPRTVIHLHGGHVPSGSDGHPEATLVPGESVVYDYPNKQPAATLWYHDHAMGITRLNVTMGLAGMYVIRDASEVGLGLPSGANEVPLVLQDRTFGPDGQMVYPEMWHAHAHGETNLVNGVVWPYLNVRKGKYRFRVLNGAGSRTYTLALSNGATFHVIGTDGGLLPAPVARTEITLMPGERHDIVIDFASYATGTEIVLRNSAPAPFPGPAGSGVVPDVMKFVVTATAGHTAALPATLVTVPRLDPSDAVISRDLVLTKRTDPCTGEAWTIDGRHFHDITEKPMFGTTEVWRFVNPTGVAHPMHLHLVQFQILDRQPFDMVNGVPMPTGPAVAPPAHEAGWKDTVAVGASEMVRVIARFDGYTGKYPYHCHILEHEDWDMMRQFEVLPPPDAGVDDGGIGDAGDAGDGGDAGHNMTGSGGGCCQSSGGGNSLGALLVGCGFWLRRRRRT